MHIRIRHFLWLLVAVFSVFSCTQSSEVLEEIDPDAAEDYLIQQYIIADSVFVADTEADIEQYYKFGVYMTTTGTTNGQPIDTDRKISYGDSMHITYTGWVMGPEAVPFDSNVLLEDPFELVLGKTSVIEGWNIALFEMHEHEIARVVIPSKYGYGATGNPPSIPPNSSLVFNIQIDSLWTTDEQ
ncbi:MULTISPECIES: FKBP-type peptidyl-prolyl cis-trans isomerase [Flammeovirga]|uniref:Peptidyl-prolyl cis-trans isomerase n=1 Tax=Flammeovirga agarivorans TaxID=2726742 RepID=A0A7X8SMJ2_9BACT|nr:MULTISPECIES: FKBP-type peptidyl-prolyl cis-trans isomerase [Flammeovirga]NLR92968.1 FKBP-type peptidyl-prolyl cis-trans isomerase [Flammeovirga agarivorans]